MPPEFTPNLDWLLRAYHPDDRDRMIDILRTTLEDGTSFTVTARIVRPDGTIRTVATGGQVERAPDGTIVGLFGILQDMTSIKAIEIERERLNERVILATKAGKIGIWEWTIASDRLEWDSAMYALYGRASGRGEPSYDMWLSAIDPRDRERAAIEVERALSGTAPLDMEFRVIWPSGESRQLRAIGTLLIDPQGGSPRMVGANWDISETRALADDLREEKERAEQANRAKTEFLARMSHEIRTPMNGIIGFTTLVLDGELSAEQRRYVSLLRDAGRSLLAIINDILDFSKLEAGRIELESIPVNLSALIDGALSIVRSEAIPKGIVLDIDIDSAVPQWVSGDPTRLRQTLLNLLTNALKFTDHGSIAVRVERERGPLPDRLRVEIADTGIGIASESQHLLFSDFSQLEKSTPRRYGGTGLGLAICKRLVEAMNGSIGVRSEAGAGSVFWFTARLPEVGAPTAGALHDQTPRVQARRILVADDNRVNQIVVSGLLTRDGHDVTLVENGREAVDAVRDGVYDLVLMDMQMPLMDGIEATLAIRQLAAPRGDIAIVALTANAMEEEVERCHAAGMNGHLAKPIDRELLRRAITRWTGNHDRSQALPPALEPAGSPADADPPSIGVAALLDIFDGDVPSVCDILRAARSSIEIDLERITSAVRTQDAAMVQEAAHRMKGTSGSIRCARILTISAALGEAAKSGLSAIEPALVRDLESAIAALRNDVDAYLRHASTPTVTPSSAPSIGQSPG
jgi:signal transduction histidine kinase/AmiR/NasT family two-component response regulator/HPt (histidine-containing phosphotransfer) domain-containing protein